MFLDVLCLKGAASCLAQVGKAGRSVGIDVKRAAVQLGRSSVQNLARADAEYATKAADIRFFVHNVFMPSLRHKVASPPEHPPSLLWGMKSVLSAAGTTCSLWNMQQLYFQRESVGTCNMT